MNKFRIKFLWLDKNLGVAIDKLTPKGTSPVTEYFFWPRKDAWEELRNDLSSKPWISYDDSILLLNETTDVINYWQEEEKRPSLAEAQERFPNCFFTDKFASTFFTEEQ